MCENESNETRICYACKHEKHIKEFLRNDKIAKTCYDCAERQAGYRKTYYLANQEYTREHSTQYYSANREKIIQKHVDNPVVKMLMAAKHRAKVLRLPFNLKRNDLLLPDICPLLDIPMRVNSIGTKSTYDSFSLDKLIPQLGYVPQNVLVMSARANFIKSDSSLEEMHRMAAVLEKPLPALIPSDQLDLRRAKKYLMTKRTAAKQANRLFTIVLDDLVFPTHCPYLGIPLHFQEGKAFDCNAYSIDRIDSSKGYIPGNVVVCSRRANMLKNDATPQEYRQITDRLTAIFKERGLDAYVTPTGSR